MPFPLFWKRKNTEDKNNGNVLTYKLANLQGIGARSGQEDAFTVVNAVNKKSIEEQGLFFAVCDGMGGMKDGALASQTAITCLRKSFADMERAADLAPQLRGSIFSTSSEIEAVIGGDGGSTVVAGIIFRDRLYYASVGDSFLYLFRDDCLYRLNREQNLCHQNYMEEIRSGSADPSDYQEEREAGALTGFLGMRGLDDVDSSIRPLPLKSGDVLLACSDGIGGVLTEEDVKAALSEKSEGEICERIEAFILDYCRKNQDNYTAVVIRCV